MVFVGTIRQLSPSIEKAGLSRLCAPQDFVLGRKEEFQFNQVVIRYCGLGESIERSASS